MTQVSLQQSLPPEVALLTRFHIRTGFHPEQRAIIERLLTGKRVLAIQRTGWGKSLCYLLTSLYFPHLTVVFSPLKALMRDQCRRCNQEYAIPSAIVSSDFSKETNATTLHMAVAGHVKILYITPERLSSHLWQEYVSKMRISLVVIDEAHCISTWGHDFRPYYQRIVNLLTALPPHVPILALTATASKSVEQDIVRQFGTHSQVEVIRGTMLKENLCLQVVRLHGDGEKLTYLSQLLALFPGTGIVYTATRSSAELVASFLQRQGLPAEYYHADREDEMRQAIEQKLLANQYKVVCSTNALGMGIDKPNIRFIIHYHIPASPIHYYQEIGRAGRDGLLAKCVLLYDPHDISLQTYFIDTARPAAHSYYAILSFLQREARVCHPNDVMRATGLARNVVRTILANLEDQGLIKQYPADAGYALLESQHQVDFSAYDLVRQQKQRELTAMRAYADSSSCYMGYLTACLGDQAGYRCGRCSHCRKDLFPFLPLSERILLRARQFLAHDFLPRIEPRGSYTSPVHEGGWSLAYHGNSPLGSIVRACKYEQAGPFPPELVMRAVEIIRARYPIGIINGIVSIPPTKSGNLVALFAQSIALELGIPYLPVVGKMYAIQEQKGKTNRLLKEHNVKGAFAVQDQAAVAGRRLLLIDDIYDSGLSMREVSKTLVQAGAKIVYPLTITRTLHSDDQ